MSFEPQFPGLHTPEQPNMSLAPPQAPSPKQMQYARSIALKTGTPLPQDHLRTRATLSAWIDTHKPKALDGKFGNYPSSKQVAFAERIARIKSRDIPRECFHDKLMMSRWIDGNKPR